MNILITVYLFGMAAWVVWCLSGVRANYMSREYRGLIALFLLMAVFYPFMLLIHLMPHSWVTPQAHEKGFRIIHRFLHGESYVQIAPARPDEFHL